MNWTRGLFRLWLLLSVLWIAFASYGAGEALWATYLTRAKNSAVIDQIVCGRDQACSDAAEQRYLKASASPEMQRADWETRFSAFAFIVGGPLVFLALGLTLRWLVIGFRRNK